MQSRRFFTCCLNTFLVGCFVFLSLSGHPISTSADALRSAAPHIVRDINTCTQDSSPSLVTQTDQTIYFVAYQVGVGTSLWQTDGTEVGTLLVKTLYNGTDDFFLSTRGAWIGGNFYFLTRTETDYFVRSFTLWTSDGTSAGTYSIQQIESDMDSPHLSDLVVVNQILYFLIYEPNAESGKIELWRSNGTYPGTRVFYQMAARNPRGRYRNINLVGLYGALYFQGGDEQYSSEIWQSDGTTQGTQAFLRLDTRENAFPGEIIASGKHFYFSASNSSGQWSLWRSDGTPGGTVSLPNGEYSWDSSAIVELNGIAYFHGSTHYGQIYHLFRSDFTAAGTWMVKDVSTAVTLPKSSPSIGRVGDELYFSANNSELWKTNGTEAGTVFVKNLSFEKYEFVPDTFFDLGGSIFYFTALDWGGSPTLWRSDGTEAGTMMVGRTQGDLYPEPFWQPVWAIQPDRVITTGNPGAHCAGLELVRIEKIDNQLPTLTLVKDIETRTKDMDLYGSATGVRSIISYRSREYFPAMERLWSSDGSENGTQLVAARGELSLPFKDFSCATAGGLLYFAAFERNRGQLWRTDGTLDGTIRLTDVSTKSMLDGPYGLVEYNHQLYFYFVIDGIESLWTSDGTPEGTRPVYSFSPELRSKGDPIIMDGNLYLFLSDSQGLSQLYRSDGTSGGTSMIRAWNGPKMSLPFGPVQSGGRLYIVVGDTEHGIELWVSDGTPEGTHIYQDLTPGTESTTFQFLVALKDGVFLVTSTASNYSVWTAGGTADGVTELLQVDTYDSYYQAIDTVKSAGGIVYFTVNIPTDRILWRTDGTIAGTSPIKSDVEEYLPLRDKVYISVATIYYGTELWTSDGTADGTKLAFDLWPGSSSSKPRDMYWADGKLWFTAEDAEHGRELWVYDPSPLVENRYMPVVRR